MKKRERDPSVHFIPVLIAVTPFSLTRSCLRLGAFEASAESWSRYRIGTQTIAVQGTEQTNESVEILKWKIRNYFWIS